MQVCSKSVLLTYLTPFELKILSRGLLSKYWPTVLYSVHVFIVTCVGRSKGLHMLLLRLILPRAIWPIRNVQYKIYWTGIAPAAYAGKLARKQACQNTEWALLLMLSTTPLVTVNPIMNSKRTLSAVYRGSCQDSFIKSEPFKDEGKDNEYIGLLWLMFLYFEMTAVTFFVYIFCVCLQ